MVPVLMHSVPGAPIFLAVDASDSHLRCPTATCTTVLVPPYLLLPKLSNTETCNLTFNCELLAAFSTIRHFWFLLAGRDLFYLWITNL